MTPEPQRNVLARAVTPINRNHGTVFRSDDHSLAMMADRARGRLDYNHSRSGYAAPATELARYVLVLLELRRLEHGA